MIQKNLPLLLDLLYANYNRALPQRGGGRGDFQPIFNADGTVNTTFCNRFISAVCSGYGYPAFDGKTANEIFAFMGPPANGWVQVADAVAQQHANEGVIVIAAKANPSGHGHVCFIAPGLLQPSTSWGRPVPKCVNVGKDVFFGKPVSWAFKAEEQPTYYAYGPLIA